MGGTKTYGDLDLRAIREACGLDFAHYTYRPNQCTCCYGPEDQAKKYWHNGIILTGHDYSYILFKNAKNCCGAVKTTNRIKNYTCINWRMNEEQLTQVCKMLQEQLGDGYIVDKPADSSTTITIFTSDKIYCTETARKKFDLTYLEGEYASQAYQAFKKDTVYANDGDNAYYLYALLESMIKRKVAGETYMIRVGVDPFAILTELRQSTSIWNNAAYEDAKADREVWDADESL